MDTLDLLPRDSEYSTKFTTNLFVAWTLVLLLPLVFNPPLMADDIAIAQAPVPALNLNTEQVYTKIIEDISPETKIKRFNDSVQQRYPNAVIKDIEPGIKHIRLTKYYNGKPVKINIVELDNSIATDYELRPALSSTTNNLKNKRTITTIAKNTNSIAAVNGTFFKPQSGIPLGTLMIDQKIYTGPIYNRVALGIFNNKYETARIELKAKLSTQNHTLKIDNINQPRMLSSYALVYTREWGDKAPISPKYGYQIAVKDNKVVNSSSNPLIIPEGGYVIVAPYRVLEPFTKNGTKVKLDIKTSPEWNNVKHIISGGPYLVKDSNIYIDTSEEKLNAIGGKNPRTAIGYTKDNTLIMVAVDGREYQSIGMTLGQLANFMKSIGCTNAINLDGGGSTVMYVNGQVVNSPAFKGGIAISNALVIARK